MTLTEEMIHEKLEQNFFATLVTKNGAGLNSRTMTYGYLPKTGIFILTQKSSEKVNEIGNDPVGLFHISQIESDIAQSYDISISGTFERCEESSPYYKDGFEAIGKKNPQVLYLLNSEAKADYELLLFHIKEIKGWNYFQAINHMPKTIISR